MIFFRFFSKKWILATIIVMIGMGVLIRLGFWQLDRLEQRRSFNERVTEQMSQPPLDMNSADKNEKLEQMEYREVYVTGEYDFSNQVGLRNQAWNDLYGVHLITPLIISGSDKVIMVDRGWIPAEDMDPKKWSKYDESGQVEVHGVIRNSQSRPDFGRITDPIPVPGEKVLLWNMVNISLLNTQMPYDLRPVYITQYPQGIADSPPYRKEIQLDLTEGPHFGYAIQWFTFSGILLIIYVIYVRREEIRSRHYHVSVYGLNEDKDFNNMRVKKSTGEVMHDA